MSDDKVVDFTKAQEKFTHKKHNEKVQAKENIVSRVKAKVAETLNLIDILKRSKAEFIDRNQDK